MEGTDDGFIRVGCKDSFVNEYLRFRAQATRRFVE